MLRQKKESNALTVLKKQKELANKEQREESVISGRAFREESSISLPQFWVRHFR